MFVCKKKNRSGGTSEMVVDKSLGKFTEVKTMGVTTSEEDIAVLVVRGKDWIVHYDGQQTINLKQVDERKAYEKAVWRQSGYVIL